MTEELCEVCETYEALYTIEWGKRIFETITWQEKYRVCEICVIDYEEAYKQDNLPYRIKTIKEKVVFV